MRNDNVSFEIRRCNSDISEKDRGITLLALVITIMVLIILAVVTYNLTFGESGIITRANESKYMTILAQFKDEVELFKAEKLLENPDFNASSLTAGYNSLNYEPKPEGETGTIYDVMPSLKGSIFDSKIEIIKGELLLNSTDINEVRVAQTLGIEVNPYLIDENGVLLSAETNLSLMDESGTLVIPDSVTAIGEGAFADLTGLKTIIIPGTVKEIRQNAFRNNADLEHVILQEGIESIGSNAFNSCTKLTNIELPESLVSIGTRAFYSCVNMTEIDLPDKITTISVDMLYNCRTLTRVSLPESLEDINAGAFRELQ